MNCHSYVSVISLSLKIPEIFHLVVLGNGLVWVTETMERKTADKGELLSFLCDLGLITSSLRTMTSLLMASDLL